MDTLTEITLGTLIIVFIAVYIIQLVTVIAMLMGKVKGTKQIVLLYLIPGLLIYAYIGKAIESFNKLEDK